LLQEFAGFGARTVARAGIANLVILENKLPNGWNLQQAWGIFCERRTITAGGDRSSRV
jgi:hypothetical protein